MKFGLLLSFMLMAQMSFAETIGAAKKREEMLKRVDSLSTQVLGMRADLKKSDAVAACEKLKSVFKVFPDHLTGMGSRMNGLDGKVNRSLNSNITYLITIHQQVNLCNDGTGCENIDPKVLDKKMKVLAKSLASDRKLIQKKSLDYSNDFTYKYDF